MGLPTAAHTNTLNGGKYTKDILVVFDAAIVLGKKLGRAKETVISGMSIIVERALKLLGLHSSRHSFFKTSV